MAAPHLLSVDFQKNNLRKHMLRRRGYGVSEGQSNLLRAKLLTLLSGFRHRTIGLVWPMEDEVDLRPIFCELLASGNAIALPETPPKGEPLIFRHWAPDVAMKEGRFRTFFPDSQPVTPDILLVPLLAFDRRGFRLGYGGGYYDRTLARLKSPAFGFALSWQEQVVIPTGPYDCALDAIITEREVIRPRLR
ncbi:5-formyltetrahydrofolate cyclo-ligase [Neokomagataea tanensis]|uniref:5-formyltetrahydrofolate cyclo-ligase n=1 Tax=Neokomagataea tanensis TaxID=661191 RepID=A0A4Y6V6A7_9PROT|nr:MULTISPECIES: 5-formyltetrahydrofolate cyclo-ligase [Neokomagataea]QDH24027.1 5-formyltetrahydrofolate cyclo-ligase [Neokomagataea tanensis]